MKEENLLSIIVPVYNGEKYIVKCLESIINQVYTNIEIIIVDDGSSDKSKEIIESYISKDRRIKSIYIKNSGVSATRNLGIKNSTGKYIAFIDSDDWIDTEMYNVMMKKIIDKDLDSVLCSYVREFKSIQKKEELPFEDGDILNDSEVYQKLILNLISGKDDIEEPIMGSIWRYIFKREILINNNVLYDTSLSYSEDLIFCINILSKCKNIQILDRRFYHYRFTEDSAVTRYDENFWENKKIIYAKIKEILSSNNYYINIELQERLNIMMIKSIVLSIFNICHKGNSDNWVVGYKKTKDILNDKFVREILNRYKIKNNKYKIIQYKIPLIIYMLIRSKSIFNKHIRNLYR